MSYKTKQRIYFLSQLIFVLFLMLITGSLLPFENNYKLMTIMSGSMQPKLKTGSLALVIPMSHYEIGNIITFTDPDRPSSTTTHRIVEKESQDSNISYTTKGDANKSVDSSKVNHDQITGRLLAAVPYLGYPMAYAKTFQGLLLFVIVPSTILIYEELKKIYYLYRSKTHKYKYGWY